ncbi:metalloregulator ArsR/SmtB family transcription factor [Micromonospora sp. NPDC050495]|uniref:ArsR/SmtB family transcription factor n=1 Tax=Micromonospora sp. NPDC050495 TaxID=3154936 RepID=UPI0033EF7681
MPSQGPAQDVDAVFRAIGEPRRRAILALVAPTELSAGEIAQQFEVTRAAVSQHLQVLKEARLVTERREGTRRLYRASETGLSELRAFLEALWRQRMEAARDIVEDTGREEGGVAAAS